MHKVLVGCAMAVAITAVSAANAADIGVPWKAPAAPAAFSWSGCYVGGNVGWGWESSSFRDDSADNVFSANGVNLEGGMLDSAALQRSVDSNASGVSVGGQIGCDYQIGSSFVIGVSGSGAGADINGSTVDPYSESEVNPSTGVLTTKTDFLGDVSGRFGVTWGNALLYGKGGVAWSRNQYVADTCYCSSDSATAFSTTHTATGALVGAGVEWAVLGNWSAFVEYDHYFFGTDTVNFSAPGIGYGGYTTPLTAAVDVKQDIDAVKFGVNYRWSLGSALH